MVKYYYILFFFVLALGQSCRKSVDLKLGELAPLLVINSHFSQDSDFIITLSQTTDLESGSIKYVDNAEVSIYKEGVLEEVLEFVPSGANNNQHYRSNHIVAEIGQVYRIVAKAPGFGTAISESVIPPPSELTQISGTTNSADNQSSGFDDFCNIYFEIKDPQEYENFYHLSFYQLAFDARVQEYKMFGPLYISGVSNNPGRGILNNKGVLIEDENFNGLIQGFNYKILLEATPQNGFTGQNQLLIELRTISEDYYLYYLRLTRQGAGDDDLLDSPQIDFSNIENGKGLFSGYSVVVDTVGLY